MKATKPKWTTVATQWIYDDKSRARLIARERRKERREILKAIRHYTNFNCVPDRKVLKELEQVEWVVENLGRNVKSAKKGAK